VYCRGIAVSNIIIVNTRGCPIIIIIIIIITVISCNIDSVDAGRIILVYNNKKPGSGVQQQKP
jgi:hypothetical protein